ncbi:MAG TPA: SCO family protein [Anseongella sp.]
MILFLQGCGNNTQHNQSRREGNTEPGQGSDASGQGKQLEAIKELPQESVYQMTEEWHDQQGDTIQLKNLRGKIPVLAMVFTHCEFACPRTIADMKKISSEIPPDKASEVIFVLVSFDTERDQPQRLKEFAEMMGLKDNWLLLHGDEEAVRMLSMLLDVKYQKQAGGYFAHSNIVTLLNKEGVIVRQEEGLGLNPGPMLSAISGL